MDQIRQYVNENGFDESNNFAAACYDQNSVEELAALAIQIKNNPDADHYVDQTDCKTWGMTAQQWKDGIIAALRQKEQDVNL